MKLVNVSCAQQILCGYVLSPDVEQSVAKISEKMHVHPPNIKLKGKGDTKQAKYTELD